MSSSFSQLVFLKFKPLFTCFFYHQPFHGSISIHLSAMSLLCKKYHHLCSTTMPQREPLAYQAQTATARETLCYLKSTPASIAASLASETKGPGVLKNLNSLMPRYIRNAKAWSRVATSHYCNLFRIIPPEQLVLSFYQSRMKAVLLRPRLAILLQFTQQTTWGSRLVSHCFPSSTFYQASEQDVLKPPLLCE